VLEIYLIIISIIVVHFINVFIVYTKGDARFNDFSIQVPNHALGARNTHQVPYLLFSGGHYVFHFIHYKVSLTKSLANLIVSCFFIAIHMQK
jgi:hypothetical protein